MTDQTSPSNPDADRGDPIDRRSSDGAAGLGDMLGGASTGAGGRLGPDQGLDRGGVTLPMSGDPDGLEGQTIPMADVPIADDDGAE
jgi:hypothetical protein